MHNLRPYKVVSTIESKVGFGIQWVVRSRFQQLWKYFNGFNLGGQGGSECPKLRR